MTKQLLKEYSFLLPYLKKAIKWSTITNGIYRKAIKYLRESEIINVEKYEDHLNKFERYEFLWKPIEGYNKTFRRVTIVLEYEEEWFYNGILKKYTKAKAFCNCDGFRKNGICSHILATYILLKRYAGQKTL